MHHLIIIYFMTSQSVAITCHALCFSDKEPLEPDVIFVTIGNDHSTAAVYGEPHLLGDTKEGSVLRRAREDKEELSNLAAFGDLDL